MNRRELLTGVIATLTAAGVPVAAASDTPAQTNPAPAVVLIEVDDVVDHALAERITEYWKQAVQGTPLAGVRCVILDRGIRVSVLNGNGKVINEPLVMRAGPNGVTVDGPPPTAVSF